MRGRSHLPFDGCKRVLAVSASRKDCASDAESSSAETAASVSAFILSGAFAEILPVDGVVVSVC
jgi:hypothetical protein